MVGNVVVNRLSFLSWETLPKHTFAFQVLISPSEREFSTAGYIFRSERSVLSPEHVDQFVFLKKNLSKKNTEGHT